MVMKDQRVSLKCSQVLGLSRLFVRVMLLASKKG